MGSIGFDGSRFTLDTNNNADLISIVSKVFGSRFNKKSKIWTFPADSGYQLYKLLSKSVKFEDEAKKRIQEQFNNLTWLWGATKKENWTKRRHKFLMSHQDLCLDAARRFKRLGLFLDTGTGKTITALSIIQEKGGKWLIICPKALILGAWVDDQESYFKNIRTLPLHRETPKEHYLKLADEWGVEVRSNKAKAHIIDKLYPFAEIVIINPESYKDNARLYDDYWTGMIIDESTMLKNHKSTIHKEIYRESKKIEHLYLLSGLPAPKGYQDYFGQMVCISTAVLGDNFYQFEKRFWVGDIYNPWLKHLKKGAEDIFLEQLRCFSLVISKDDCLDLPPITYQFRDAYLKDKTLKQYKQMEKEFVLLLDSEDAAIKTSHKAAAMMKLRQMSSGFIRDTETGTIVDLQDDSKLKLLNNTLEEIQGQVIIWAQFTHEVDQIKKLLGDSCVTANGQTKDVQHSIQAFKSGKAKYIVAHPKTLKFGITFTNCCNAVYYSYSHDYEEFYQSRDRIYRKGQTKKCTVYVLRAAQTIDNDIWQCLKDKKGTIDVFDSLRRKRNV